MNIQKTIEVLEARISILESKNIDSRPNNSSKCKNCFMSGTYGKYCCNCGKKLT